MDNVYHENEMNSTNVTNENGKENGNVSVLEISERKFSEKKKENNRKEITNRSNNNNGNDKN